MTLVVNPTAQMIWEYDNYQFNSFCVLNGVVYGANADGVFVLDSGDTDDGAEIAAHWGHGKLPLTKTQSRVSHAYVSANAGGDLTLSLATDSGEPIEYAVSPREDGRQHRYRVATAKGAVGKYWQLSVRNESGCDFRVDDISLDVAPSMRRI